MSRIDTSIHDFTNAAQEALKTGRYIKPDNEGGVRLTSGSLRGRIVNWVKNHAFPDRRRSEQVQVLKRFVALVNKEYPHAAKDKVHMALYNTGGLPFARRVLNAARYTSMANEGCEHKADQTAQLAEDVQEAVRLGYISKVTGKAVNRQCRRKSSSMRFVSITRR